MSKTKGILLIAMGHPNYGRMAFNLSVGLKNVDPHTPIAIVFAGNALDHINHYPLDIYFDYLIPAPPESYWRGKNIEYIKAKTWMFELSPFEETIFLDADILWHTIHPASDLFNKLAKVSITFQNRGRLDMSDALLDPKYSLWADVNEVKRAYAIKKGWYYQLHSEFVYFKKTDKNRAFFEQAIDNYDNLLVRHFNFGGAIPDELPFAIAMMQKNLYPHTMPFTPIYWEVTEKRILHRNPAQLYDQYYGYSTGGSYHSKTMKNFYNNLANFHFQKAGLQYPYLLQNKRDFVPDRANL